jgi:hypothetical protein
MANPPIIVNKRPNEGDTEVNALTPIRYGLRDEDTRVNLDTVYTSISYARAMYRPDELPLNDPVLESENIRTVFSVFNDAAGATLPGTPADQTIETVGPDTVYRIERTIAGPQEGFLYVSDDSNGDVPYAAEVRLEPPVYSAGTTDYVLYPDFTGVMVGLVVWPKNSGVFVFLRDDGTKRVSVTGPSSDGFGTRPVEATTVFDWSADVYTYKIFWDETPARQKVVVIAADSAGVETVLAEFDTTSMNQFLNSVVLGGDEAADPPDRVVLVVGTDGPTPGDYIDVYKADLYRYGRPLVISGARSGSSQVWVEPTESLLTHTIDDLEDWIKEGEGETVEAGTAVALVRDPSLDAADPYFYSREEQDLGRKEWFLVGLIRGQNSLHGGTFNTAMGFNIEDGTYKHVVRLLDDFFIKDVGLLDSGNLGDTASYFKAATPVDWEDAGDVQLAVLGSDSRSTIRTYFESDDELVSVDTGAYTSSLASTETKLSLGFLESDYEYYGRLNLLYLWAFMNATLFEPIDATFPEAQGWTRVTAGATRALTAENRLEITATTPGDYDIYYFEDVDYDPDSGAAVYFKGKVTAWTDDVGAVNPPRQEIGPILHITSTTDGMQLRFTKTETGRCFAYLSGDDTDFTDVLAQNEDGVRISTEIDFQEDHVYILVLKPFQHIRLYIDYSTEPAIDIPWESKGLVFRPFPTNLPPSATIGFGSLGEDSGVQMEWAFARASIGTGYDLVIFPQLTEEERVAHVYGSEAEVLIDFEDVDP